VTIEEMIKIIIIVHRRQLIDTVNYPRANWFGPDFDQILILTNPLRASMFAIARAKLLFQTAVPQL